MTERTAGQIVITEKSSQARDVRAAVGSRYGAVLPAEGHLFDLQEPEDVEPAWKRWGPVLLRPEGLYGTRPAAGGNKAGKLRAIREALRGARRVWLATDCDREGQLIGQEILEHLRYRGEVMRVMFTAQDPQTIRDAFARARPNAEYARLYEAAVARRQADQIYNLSLTRTATVTLARGARTVIGVGRVKTPTMAIVCRRELEIRASCRRRTSRCSPPRPSPAAPCACATRRASTSPSARTPRPSPPRRRGSRAPWRSRSRTSASRRRARTTCPRCRSCAARASAGPRRTRWRWRRSCTTAPARRSSPIPAPRPASCPRR